MRNYTSEDAVNVYERLAMVALRLRGLTTTTTTLLLLLLRRVPL